VRLVLAQPATGVPTGGQRADLDIRVREEQPKQLSPRVPAGTRDSYS
jgi:hypothetical protein